MLRMEAGEALAVTGPSGSGKSTLLHLIGTLDRPSSGDIEIHGSDPHRPAAPQLARPPPPPTAFASQSHPLLPQSPLPENFLLPPLAFPYEGGRKAAEARAAELL